MRKEDLSIGTTIDPQPLSVFIGQYLRGAAGWGSLLYLQHLSQVPLSQVKRILLCFSACYL